MNNLNEQEIFWASTYSKEYIKKNSNFNHSLLVEGWTKILARIDAPQTILECGANIGRNIEALNQIFPQAEKTAIEISADAATILNKKFENVKVINASILESELTANHYDLTFSMGVLIHIAPQHLLKNLEKIVTCSKKYIVIGEYFNRTPVSLSYQGKDDKLFKRDFGKFILENFGDKLTLVDYGFLWGHIYDEGGFDDITWWVFKK